MRVLEAITPSGLGGAEVFVTNLCALLPEQGVEIRLFCPAGRPFAAHAASRGIDCVSWRTFGKFDPVTLVRLARLARSTGAQVIHTHLSTASLLGAIAGRLARVPSVAHVHGLNTATCFRYSTRVLVVSEAVKKHLASQGLSGAHIEVVHNGVDLETFSPVTARPDLAAPTFGVFGRLSPEKGQRIAIEALFLVAKQHPAAKLILAGSGPDRDDLARAAAALGVAANVEFPGFVDTRSEMARCDAVLAPSLREGFGLAAVEAMAMQRPVIASSVGGLAEIVTADTGILTQPNDPEALAEAMLRVLEDRDSAARRAAAGRERVTTHFDLRTQTVRVLDVIRETAG